MVGYKKLTGSKAIERVEGEEKKGAFIQEGHKMC